MTIGFISGYVGGIVDDILSMLTNIVLVIPTLAVLKDDSVILALLLGPRNFLHSLQRVFLPFSFAQASTGTTALPTGDM